MAFYVLEVVETRYVLVDASSSDTAALVAENKAVSDLDNDDVDLYFKEHYEDIEQARLRWNINIDLAED